MRRGRDLLAGTVLAAVGVLFALVMLEVGIRFLHLVPDRFWEPDPVLGVRLIPDHHGWWTQEDREFLVPVRVNHRGLRDIDHQLAKPPGVFRILVLGDSFVEAMHVPLEATSGRLLEQQLNADSPAPRVEVISAGVSGYGTASEVLFFEREARQYEADLVMLFFYPGNDVKNNSPTLEDTLKPSYRADGTLERVIGEAPKKAAKGWRGLLARSAAYHYFRQVLLVRQPQLAQRLMRWHLLRRDAVKATAQHDGVPVDYGVYAPQPTAEWQTAWAGTERNLERLRDAVAASGARFAIAVLSSRDQVYPDYWAEILAAHPAMRNQSWDLDAPQQRIEAWCAAHAVPCVALAPLFRAAAARGSGALHYHHDGHWTAAGHRLAATVLKDFLTQHQLLRVRQEVTS